jgi:glycosyltransferase involved in cell wall biosynthesis
MNVLQLISSEGYYGAENMLLQLSQSLRALNCCITAGVFENLHRPNLEVAERLSQHGIPVEIIRCRGRLDWGAVRRIRECIKARNINVVHTHGYKANLYAYMAARQLDLPLVATCHNWPGNTAALRMYYLVDWMVLTRFDRIAVVSDRVGLSLRRVGVSAERICLIENGIDVASFARATGPGGIAANLARTRVAVIGRLAPEKGLQFFLRAAREILNKHPNTEFLLVGDGPQRPELEALTRELRIEKEVIFAGVQKDMTGVYASIDIYVLCSLNEGMPLALLEAMAASKPVVATRVGAIPTLIAADRTGLLVEPKDVAGLRDSILRLMEDSTLCQNLGRAAQRAVKARYSAELMAHRYFSMYRQVINNRAPLSYDYGPQKPSYSISGDAEDK